MGHSSITTTLDTYGASCAPRSQGVGDRLAARRLGNAGALRGCATGRLEPKTAAARRLIVLPEVAVAALKQHRSRMFAEGRLSTDGNPHHLVFVDTEGHPVRQSNLLRRSFFPLMKTAEVPRIRFHDLRHTCATLLLAQGVHPKIVQERLGHATISMTLDTYSHVTSTLQQEAAAKLDALFTQTRQRP